MYGFKRITFGKCQTPSLLSPHPTTLLHWYWYSIAPHYCQLDVTGPDKNGYYHDLFLRGRFDLSQRIGRLDTKAARSRPKGSSRWRNNPNFTVPSVPQEATTPVITPLPSFPALESLSVGVVAAALLNPHPESSMATIAPLVRELLSRRSAVVGHNSALFRSGRDAPVSQPPLLARTGVLPLNLALPSHHGMETLSPAHPTGRHRLWDHADLRALITSSSNTSRLDASSAAGIDGIPRGSMVTGAALLASLRPRGQVIADGVHCPMAAFLQSRLKTTIP
jgi:hypothetical protein